MHPYRYRSRFYVKESLAIFENRRIDCNFQIVRLRLVEVVVYLRNFDSMLATAKPLWGSS